MSERTWQAAATPVANMTRQRLIEHLWWCHDLPARVARDDPEGWHRSEHEADPGGCDHFHHT